MRKQLLLICIVLLTVFTAGAQRINFRPDQFTSRVNSSILADPGKPSTYNDTLPVAVFDRWNELLNYNNTLTPPPYSFKSIHNLVKVGVNHDTPLHVAAYKYMVNLVVLHYKAAGTGNSPFSSSTVSMIVEYDPDSLHTYQDIDVYKFSEWPKFRVVVTGIYDISNPNNPPQLVARSNLAKNFYIESEVQVQRYDYSFGYIATECSIPLLSTGKALRVDWACTLPTVTVNYCKLSAVPFNDIGEIKPILYELEWTYVDDYDVSLTSGGPSGSYKFASNPNIAYDFRRNSTRIQTDKRRFDIPLVYEHGAIVYRVRAIRPDTGSGYKDIIYSAWTLPDAGMVTAGSACFPGEGYLITTPHMNDSLNWAYSINFAEEGKYKHVINYFDGSYKNRQTQTKINTDPNYIIAVDKVYDYEGRPSVTTLPIPVNQQDLSYRPDMLLTQANQGLVAADIDKLGCTAPDSLPVLGNNALANIYYSPLNPDTFDHHKFIPDAKGYPLVQTIFSPDNTNKVLWQGSAGYELQAFKKPTRHEYTRIGPKELDRLQGTEAGKYQYYPKEIITDPNGQSSFTIYRPGGGVVATGVQGMPDTVGKPLDLLSNFVAGDTSCSNLLYGLSQEKLPGNLRTETTFYTDVNGNNSFKYSGAVPAFYPGCNATNKYLWAEAKLDVKVVNDCGVVMDSISTPVGRDSILAANTPAYFASSVKTMNLTKGKYMLTKELKFSEYGIKKLVDSFILKNQPGCYHDEPFFVRRAVENASFPCIDSGGTNPCDLKRKQMIQELYPGAKYGLYAKRNDSSFLLGADNSIFSFVIDSNAIGNGTIIYQNGTTPRCDIQGCGTTQSCSGGNGCGCSVGAHYFNAPCCAACLQQQCECIQFGVIRTIDTNYVVQPISINPCQPAGPLIDSVKMEIDNCHDYGLGNTPYPFTWRKFSQMCSCGNLHTSDWIRHVALANFYIECNAPAPFDFNDTLWRPYVTNWLFVENGATGQWNPTWCPNTSTWQGIYDVTSTCPFSCTQWIGVPSSYDTTYTPLAGAIYMRYQSSCVTLPAVIDTINQQSIDLAAVPVDTFIAWFNDEVAAALLPLHPEYCKLLACNGGDYLEQFERFNNVKEAEAANRFDLHDIITNDPVYTATPSGQQAQVYNRLSTLPGIGKSIDQYALEMTYCGAGNLEELTGCIAGAYSNEIQSFSFINDDVKQRYFETLRSLYISNRNIIQQQTIDVAGNSCQPCPAIRMTLTGYPVFETIYDANGNVTNQDIPAWMQALFDSSKNGTMSGTGVPTQVSDSMQAINQKLLDGKLDAIMKALANCSLSPTDSTNIRANLASAGTPFTPAKLTDAITSAGVSITDLCHPFLVNYGAWDNSGTNVQTYDCGDANLYSGLASFFARTEVTTTIQDGAFHNIFGLDLNNVFEKAISDRFGGAVNVAVRATPQSVSQTMANNNTATINYTTILVTKYPVPTPPASISQADMIFFNVNSDLSALTTFAPASAGCLNDDDNAMKDGLIAQKSAILYAHVNGSSTLTPFYIWNDRIDLMKGADDASIATCISCKEIWKALEDFKSDKTTYGYHDAFNHPLFQKTLASYLNNKLHRNYSFYDYYELMSGCGVTDKVTLTRNRASYLVQYAGDNNADIFIGNLANPAIVVRRQKIGSVVQLYLDLNVVPKDSILWYKAHIISIGSGATLTYLPSGVDAVYAKNGIASLPTPVTNLFGSYTSQQVDVQENGTYQTYTYHLLNNSYSTPYARAQAMDDLRNALSGQPGTFAIFGAELLRSGDYNTTLKQAYLNNVYGIVSNDHTDIVDTISTDFLKQQVAAFSGKTLSYDDPYCSLRKTDLYVRTSNSSHPGFLRIKDSILTPVKNQASGKLFWQTAYADFSSYGGKIAVVKKVNGAYWYRLFTAANRMYNVHVQPPRYTQYALNNYVFSSVEPTWGKDSILFFNLYMAYNYDTILCRGYTDFSLGYCQKVEKVMLYEQGKTNVCLDSMDCEHDQLITAVTQGKAAYSLYFDSTSRSIRDSMIRYLVNNTKDTLMLCAQEAKYQYTLYYYDRAGNLTRTVPPQGVTPVTSNASLGQIATYRDGTNATQNATALTSHKKVSVYKYNAQNQVYYQETPDGGGTYFFYDGAGRLLFSQNSRQRVKGLYSYTLYDRLSRITETGEVKLGCVLGGSSAVFDTTHCNYTINGQNYNSIHPPYVQHAHNGSLYPIDTIVKYISSKTRTNVVITLYDTSGKDLGAIANEHLSTQEHLLKRVSSILYHPVVYNTHIAANYANAIANPYFGTHYSYDLQGNVKTVTYEYAPLSLVKQKYKRVDYEYDVISGKVTQVSYNRSRADQFFHKYEYDADNRITAAYTSKDGLVWNKDARYTYYHHGPLASATIGDLKVQGIDYAYTINGWLKAINGDVLRPELDMGRNGIAAGMIAGVPGDTVIARDVIAHALDYFTDDYKSITANSPAHLPGAGRNLYNGNIVRQTTAIGGLGNMQRHYRYDQLQRLTQATNQLIDEASLQVMTTPANLYKSTYAYDRDGNITGLVRYEGSATPALLDNFSYHYTANNTNNRLLYVTESANAVSGGRDLKPGQPSNNYSYDATGNLTGDRQGHIKIGWLPNGKVELVEDTVANTFLRFTYDGAGNRIFKDYIKKISNSQEDHKGEYYVRDASGNILAVYNTHSSYSPISIVSAAVGPVKGDPNFPAFLVDQVAVKGSFRMKMIGNALETNPSWVTGQTNKPISFYLNRDEDLYNLLLFTDPAYFDDLRDYDVTEELDIYAGALLSDPDQAQILLYEVLSKGTELESDPEGEEAIALLLHFDKQLPPEYTEPMWDYFGVPHTESAEENAANLYAQMRDMAAFSDVATEMITILGYDISEQALTFYREVIGDNVIFQSPKYRGSGSGFEYVLSSVLYQGAQRDNLDGFFDQWEQSPEWLSESVPLDRRMEIVYDDNPVAAITSFVEASQSNQAVEEVISEMPEIPALDFALRVVTNFADAASAVALALGASADTITLAEHHIYGSSRLGIQTYDSLYRNTYHVNPSIAKITRLEAPRSYYSSLYGDYVKASYKEPWGGVDKDSLREMRTLGRRYYELTDHLGNVLATVMDRRTGGGSAGIGTLYSHWKADLASVQDYYPFGMMMPGRFKMMNNDTMIYRHGFGGQHKDNEIYGLGNYLDFGERGLDIRTIHWITRDKMASKYPGISPYVFCRDNPITQYDPDGNTDYKATVQVNKNTKGEVTKTITVNVVYAVVNISKAPLYSANAVSGGEYAASSFTGQTSYKEGGKTVNVNIQTNIRYKLVENINQVKKGENIMFVVDDVLPMPGDKHPNANPVARAAFEGNVMAVESKYKNNLTAIWHEMGHNFGFWFANNQQDPTHSPSSGDLMYKNVNGSTRVDKADLNHAFSDVIRKDAGTYNIEGNRGGDVQNKAKDFLDAHYEYDQSAADKAGL